MQEIVEKYLAAWNETDPAKRRALVDEVWAEDGSYTDPLADVRGRAEIDGLIGAVQQQFPGFVSRSGAPWTRTMTRPGSAGIWGRLMPPSRSSSGSMWRYWMATGSAASTGSWTRCLASSALLAGLC